MNVTDVLELVGLQDVVSAAAVKLAGVIGGLCVILFAFENLHKLLPWASAALGGQAPKRSSESPMFWDTANYSLRKGPYGWEARNGFGEEAFFASKSQAVGWMQCESAGFYGKSRRVGPQAVTGTDGVVFKSWSGRKPSYRRGGRRRGGKMAF